MFFTNTTFVGIDPTAGERPITYAALDQQLNLLAIGKGDLEQVLAFVAGQREALVAVCAPRKPNQGLMERAEVRRVLSPPPRPGRWLNFRLAEYQLRLRNISSPRTPADQSLCPRWVRSGFNLYRRLEGLGYQPYPADKATVSPFPEEDGLRQCLEVYPHASFTILLGHSPFPKHTLEGRLQRQLILYELDLNLPNPMRFFEEITRRRLLQGILPVEGLYLPEQLDALVAAYTGWLANSQAEQVTLLGHAEEGYVVLPAAELKNRY
ncbi:MAG TPA: DUF429 domain-containing protein [Anaerolineales bacterium]|nr:DUF429 domain-containing protein [Anaerolineales bacterium]